MFKNIRNYRKLLGFTQREFALLINISQVYLSHIETYRKPLLGDIAVSIADALNSIVADILYHEANIKNIGKISPESLRIGHNISRYPQELQGKALESINRILISKCQLDYMLEHGKEPPEEVSRSVGQQSIEIVIKDVLKLSCSKKVLKAIKLEVGNKVKLSIRMRGVING